MRLAKLSGPGSYDAPLAADRVRVVGLDGVVVGLTLANQLEFAQEEVGFPWRFGGFVAADDVLRAVTLMVRNAVREYGSDDDFVGHLGPENFVIITDDEVVEDIRDRIERRISQSREYFYPLRDRDSAKQAMEEEHLRLTSGIVTQSDGPFEDINALKAALHESAEAAM